MANLLDLMQPDERERALAAFERRKSGDTSYRKDLKIPPEVYLIAELGYYYGWGAIEAAKRGHVESFETVNKNGERIEKRTKIALTMEEIAILVEAAHKIWYGKIVDQARGMQIATGSVMSKHPNATFNQGIKPFEKRARV